MRTANTLIRLGGCPGWYESLLGARAIFLVLSWAGSFVYESCLYLLIFMCTYMFHTRLVMKWASSWDFGTYRIGDQQRLRRACASAQSRQSLRCSHTWTIIVDGSRRRVRQKIGHLVPLNGCACVFEEWINGGRKVPKSHELAKIFSTAILPL